jgi:hypothetical protein
VTLTDALQDVWDTILDITSIFVMPDWAALIGLLPILIFFGVVMPLITFTLLGSLIYLIRKPRARVEIVEGPRVAEIGEGGQPVFQPGLPHCRRDALVFASGTLRCDRCGDDLAVICPMCGLGRSALIDTCSDCGLVLKVRPTTVVVASAPGPKPGGAAVA